jgi:hypothetical protein
MVKNNINHAPLNPEGMLKLFIRESRYWTNPVTKNTLLCLLVGAFGWVGRLWADNSATTTFSSQRRKAMVVNRLNDNLTDNVVRDGNILQQELDKDSKGNQNLKESNKVH